MVDLFAERVCIVIPAKVHCEANWQKLIAFGVPHFVFQVL